MENNNYSPYDENNTNHTQQAADTANGDAADRNGTAGAALTNSGDNRTESAFGAAGAGNSAADAAGQPAGSAYGYSYINQEQKNPNNIWRAEENTAGAYTSGNAQAGSGQTYADSTYSTQAGSGSAYGSARTDAGSTQAGSDNAYSSIYGNTAGHNGWSNYSEAKKQKEQERAAKRAKKNAGGGSSFGIKLAKCASIALVFGLVAGTAFEGSSYIAGGLLGNDRQEAAADEGSREKEASNSAENSSAEKTTEPVASQLSTDSSVVPIVEKCMPSIVAITNLSQVQMQNFFGQVQNYEIPSAGSGIIISEDDTYLYIATNNHVVSSQATASSTLTVQFNDKTTAEAQIKGTDPSTDLAAIQVKKADIEADTLASIKMASFGDSDSIQVGSTAIAIGNALGYGQSVTTGVVSAVDRDVTIEDDTTGESYTNSLIQTDAAINPGNSGGALLNAAGEVIGINSSKYSDTQVEGMGFAIPSSMAQPIIEDLITKEEVSEQDAAFLGVDGRNVTSSVAQAYNMPEGVFINEVTKGSAAEEYGLKQGDIITKLDGRDIKTKEALRKRLTYYKAGTEVEVTIQRSSEGGYKEMTVSVVLGSKN